MNCLFCHHVKNIDFDTTHFSSLGMYITFLFVLCHLFSFLGFKTVSFTHITAPLMAISLLLVLEKAVLFISPLSCPIGESPNLFELSVHIYKVKNWTRCSLWSHPILKLYAVLQKTWKVIQYGVTLEDKDEESFFFILCKLCLDTIPWLIFHTPDTYTLRMWGRTSLVAQWLRIRLPMQGTWVQALVREHTHAVEQLNPRATTTEAGVPRAHAPPQEKPPQWEARALQWRVAPARSN